MSKANTALFSPIKVGKNELKHRVVLAPLTRFRANEDGTVTDLQKEYYTQRASEGGLLITEATFITRTAGSYYRAPGIYTKEQVESWKKVTEAVHAKGGVIYLQLWHIGRAALSKLNLGQQPVSSTEKPIPGLNVLGDALEVPRALTPEDIKGIIGDYVQAARNAVEAGFDGVEVHSANGYLLDQFLNSNPNNRTDEYGGTPEKRSRFTYEVVEAVAAAIGAERTGLRLSPWSGFQDVEDDAPYETWGILVKKFQQNIPNLAYIHFIEPKADFCVDHYEKPTETIDPFRKEWKGPFIAGGGYTYYPEEAFKVAEETGSLIAFGRAFIANPDLPDRLLNGYPLTKYDRDTFYTNEPKGYTDYPFYNDKE